MGLVNATMQVIKSWDDALDPTQRPESVTLQILQDDHEYSQLTLDATSEWQATLVVAPGLFAGDKKLEPGHNYSVKELDGSKAYELSAETIHPMLVNGVLQKTTSDSAATLVATNALKGEIAITKIVTTEDGETVPADAEFSFKVGLKDASGQWGGGALTYRVYESDGSMSYKGTISDGGTISLQASQTARILLLPSQMHYTIEEQSLPGSFKNTDSSNATGTTGANTLSTVTFTNNYATTPAVLTQGLEVTRVLEGRPWLKSDHFEFTLAAIDAAPLPEQTTATATAGAKTASFGRLRSTGLEPTATRSARTPRDLPVCKTTGTRLKPQSW